ncbi:JAB domain-containing protein [Polaribacter atrinae]|uniref:JAB domain-containing protein n=1 Tax=Polaribacter atrinae TaxID=1333662 RepID=UPI0030FB8C08
MNLSKLFSIKEIDISYSYGTAKADRKKITSSLDAKDIFHSLIEKSIEYKESFLLLVLNNSNEILGIKKISEGGITSTIVDIRLIFQTVLKAHGVGFIICHNHPSGKLEPSNADKHLTEKIKEGAQTLDLKLLDHLIITKESAFSFADEGIL